MDLPALHAFVKVVQTGSFTRAAEALGSQKAHLSRLVSQLERELGARLLERTTRALSLTELGREFFERAVGILAAVEDAQRAIQNAHGEPRGTLRLTCSVDFGMIAVSSWMQRYLQRYPEVRIEADFTSRLVDLVHEGFDLAIRVGPLADSSLAARKLGDLDYALLAAPDYLGRHGTPAAPAELADHHILAFSGSGPRTTLVLTQGEQTQHLELNARLKASNVSAVRDAAVAGLGIAKLPLITARSALARGQLQVVLPEWTLPRVPVHAVFASARYLTPKVRQFIDLAVVAMQSPAPPASAV